jgi:aminopeptidase N
MRFKNLKKLLKILNLKKMENEENPNLVELLKQALLFYADETNYTGAMGNYALITADKGSQARFALTKIEEFTKNNNELEADYIKNMNEAIASSESPENMLKIIEGFKNIANGD